MGGLRDSGVLAGATDDPSDNEFGPGDHHLKSRDVKFCVDHKACPDSGGGGAKPDQILGLLGFEPVSGKQRFR